MLRWKAAGSGSEEALAEEGRVGVWEGGLDERACRRPKQHTGSLGNGPFPHKHHRVDYKAVKIEHSEECVSHREMTKRRKGSREGLKGGSKERGEKEEEGGRRERAKRMRVGRERRGKNGGGSHEGGRGGRERQGKGDGEGRGEGLRGWKTGRRQRKEEGG